MSSDDATLDQIRRLNAGLHWKKVETLFKKLGADVYEGSGSTVTFVLGVASSRSTDRIRAGVRTRLVKRIRSFLEGLGHL